LANLDFIEKDLIDRLLNNCGYVLDFSDRTYQEFIYEKIQIDVFAKYPNLSKGKKLREILKDFDDIIVGKLLLEFLRYMQAKDMVNDENSSNFKKCAEIGNRLIGKTISVKTASTKDMPPPSPILSVVDYDKYLNELIDLSNMSDTPQTRGFAFEKYLHSLFSVFSLQPRGSFKIEGEQIDGSFILKDEVYLLEAKWTTKPIDKSKLIIFNSNVSSKSGFSRGLFVSFSDFSNEALSTFARGTTVNIILMTVQEIGIILSKKLNLENVLFAKVRALAEEGLFYKNIMEMQL